MRCLQFEALDCIDRKVDNVKAEDGGGEEGGGEDGGGEEGGAVCLHLLLPHISECDGGAVNGVMNQKYDI